MRYRLWSVMALSTAMLAPTAAFGQKAYEIGVSAALTGPAASTIAPAIDGLSLYVRRLNDQGGINGHRIHLTILDDRGNASSAASNTQQLLSEDHVALLVNASISSTYAPMIEMAERADIPLLFAANAVCPSQVFPPAKKLLFCSSGISPQYDGRAAINFIKNHAAGKVKLGLVAMAIPVSRGGINFAGKVAQKEGMQVVANEAIPPVTADYTPYATNIKSAGADWAYSWAPWVTEVKTLQALRRLGWNGQYVAAAQPVAENELKRLKDGNFYIVNTDALFAENLPIEHRISALAKSAHSRYPANEMTEGWIAGMVLEAALEKAGWPVNTHKLLAAMDNLKVSMHGLRGGPIVWTKHNHFRTHQYYRVYGWSPKSMSIARAQNWQAFDIK